MQSLRDRVRTVQIRQQQQWIWQCASIGLLTGGLLGCCVAVVRVLTSDSFSWMWVAVTVLVPLTAGIGWAFARSQSLQSAARFIDQRCNLKDRAQTALHFLETPGPDPLRKLQVEDAETHLNTLDLSALAPVRAPRSWTWGVLSSVVAILIAFLSGPEKPLMASGESNPVVQEQADVASESLEELKEFQQKEKDPDLDRLLQQMNRQLTELHEPGLAPKEALAKLSEMEAQLQAMQQQLTESSAESQLKEIGEALSLAESMAQAGQALSKGDMEKAAAELAKMETPQLDRKTEKAVSEKLEKAKEQLSNSEKKQPGIQEAVEKMQQGLSSGNKNEFEEGAKGLAGECKKQGRKKELAELLRKQCQSLGECKSECESECRSLAQGSKPGGKQAGNGRAGDPASGQKSSMRKTGEEVKLTGQDSGKGDAETETETNPEQNQEAVRQYRQNAQKYEALSESALESESIPLGHRQTIRRYFELIRPQPGEVDAVNEKTSE